MFSKILVPVDLAETELTQRALEVATELGRASNADLRIMSVQVPLPSFYLDSLPPEAGEALRAQIEEQMANVACGVDFPTEHLSITFRFGTVYREVLAEADEWGPDLITVGSHRPRMATYLLGSNANNIVRHAKCSVLVVRK